MSPILSAFLLGLVSACSLPLGAITAMFWKPGGRTIAFLMSFGGGALLAALTIDLAGPALEKGHFYPLAGGCVVGGALFVVLNQVVNQHGGFLRKASTTIFYLRGLRRRRHQQMVAKMRRLHVFSTLSEHELRELADSVKCREIKEGAAAFHNGDPATYFGIVESGQMQLRHEDAVQDSEALKSSDAFGHKALFTGFRHHARAVAKEDSTVLVVPRETLLHLLNRSPELRVATANYLKSEEIASYLETAQRMPADRVPAWTREASGAVLNRGSLPPPADDQLDPSFNEYAQDVHRVPFFHNLPASEVREIASRVFARQVEKGHTFFYRDEPADRMYIVQSGEVALIDAQDELRSVARIVDHEAFGTMSFLTGTRHASTAVSAIPTSVWVITRVDFDELMECCPHLAHAVQDFLKKEDVSSYLQKKHHLDSAETAAWVSRAVRSMDLGRLIPPAAELKAKLDAQHGAPLAIWLGILLDGVPESLVIGSSMLHDSVSLSLIAGLFLSNYPEALSSSIGMQEQGMKWSRVILMWTALMVITGLGAALGNLFFREAPETLFSLVQGIAAGAMLTMIAETMLPEAYFKGGSVVGFSTLLGFLAAIFFKTIG